MCVTSPTNAPEKGTLVTAALLVLALSLVLTVAVGVVVVLGGTDLMRDHQLAAPLRRANQALNGEGDVPEKLVSLFR